MKRLFYFLILFTVWPLWAQQTVVPSTPYTRNLLRSQDAGSARSLLGVTTTAANATNQTLWTPTFNGGIANGVTNIGEVSTNPIVFGGTSTSHTNVNEVSTGGLFNNGTFAGGTNNATVIGGAQTNSINTWSSNNAANVVLGMIVTNLGPEVWISASNSAADVNTGIILGTGTRLNPFYGDFDAINLNNNFASKIVHLGPGVFASDGHAGFTSNYWVQPNETLIGAGMNLTTISNVQNYNTDVEMLYSVYSNITLSSFTIDCNGHTNAKVNGLIMTGDNITVEKVAVKNWDGIESPPAEGFAMIIGQQGAKGLVLRDCVISNNIGTYDTGYALSGTVLMTGNQAIFQQWTNAASSGGYECGDGWPQGSIIANNVFKYGYYGWYLDTASCSNILICNNSYISNYSGPFFNCLDINGVNFRNNTVILDPNPSVNVTNNSRGFFRVYQNTSNVANIFITGNTFMYGPGGNYGNNPTFNGKCEGIAFRPSAAYQTVTNVLVANNVIGTNFSSGFYYTGTGQNASGLNFRDNVDQNGNPVLWGALATTPDMATANYSYTNIVSQAQNLPQNVDPSDGLNSGLIYNVSLNEGKGTNVFNYANSYGLFGTQFMTNGYITPPIVWTNGQVGYGIFTTNNAPNPFSSPGPAGSMTNCIFVPNNICTSLSGTSNFTIQVVCKQGPFSTSYPTPFFGGYQASANPWFSLVLQPGGNIGWQSASSLSNNYYGVFFTSTDGQDNAWHDYAFTWNGVTMTLYVDGASATSWPFPGTFQTITSADYGVIDAMMNGSVNSVKIWNRTLNANEVKLAYRKFFSP